MKQIILFLVLLLSLQPMYSQRKEAGIIILDRYHLGKATVVDSSDVRVYYALNADSLDNKDTYVDMRVLEVGQRITKCSSEFVPTGCHALIPSTEYDKTTGTKSNIPTSISKGRRQPSIM